MGKRSNLALRFASAFVLAIVGNGASARPAGSEVRIDWRLAPTDKAGSEKSGAACFPNGELLWREVAKPDDQLVDSRLRALLQSHGIEQATVSGEITSLKSMVCSPWLGIGAKPKSEIKLSIKWTVQSDSGPPINAIIATRVARKQFDLRNDPELLLEALESSLQESLLNNRLQLGISMLHP